MRHLDAGKKTVFVIIIPLPYHRQYPIQQSFSENKSLVYREHTVPQANCIEHEIVVQ